MAYSRWGGSRFYTFWISTDSTVGREQKFHIQEIGPSLTFTFTELHGDMQGCLDKTEAFYAKEREGSIRSNGDLKNPEYEDTTFPAEPLSKADRKELTLYMLRFLEDVKKDKELEW